MGEVYRARDTRLDRTVAVKILPKNLSEDPEFKQRFEREARAISSLNHAHICQLFDVGSQDGTDFLVMEFLDGETLAERLRKGPVPLHELSKTGVEIAEALAVAHRAGIVHRDLKPGNIMLTRSGAKLMDFGLAKPASLGAPGSGSAPLLSAARTVSGPSPITPLTTAGSIVGTIQYMSPEQIEGKDADARADIFAFGAVLYEMATGKRAFEGKSQISVASAILEKDPEPVSATRKPVSPVLEHVIARALQKDPEKRWQSASDIAAELQWASDPATSLAPDSLPANTVPPPRSRWLLGLASVAVIAAVLGAVLTLSRRPAENRRLVAALPPPEDLSYDMIGDAGGPPAISPDGVHLVFGAGGRLWLRSIETGEVHPVEGTESAEFPFWSPDSRKVAFFSAGKLKTVDASGGAPMTLCDAPNPRGGAWSSKGVLLFTPNIRSALYKVPAAGGVPEPVTTLDTTKHSTHRWPQFLPDGDHFLYLATNHSGLQEFAGIYLGSLSGSPPKTGQLISTGADATYSSGYVLFLRKNDLMAQRFDAGRLQLQGDPVRIADKVVNDQAIWRGVFTASNNGLLVYATGANAIEDAQLTWFDAHGTALGSIGEKGSNDPRLSHDGHKLALEFGEPNPDIWVFDTSNGLRTRLTSNGSSSSPVWSRDGKNLAYMAIPEHTSKAQLTTRAADGTGTERRLYAEEVWQAPTDWSPDGKYILYDRGEPGATDIFVLPLAGDQKPFPFVQTPAWERGGVFSPDGHWVAYTSRESGRDEVYVAPFPGPGSKWQVSSSGADTPHWRPDGKALIAVNGDDILEFPITIQQGAIQTGPPKTLFHTAIGQTMLFNASYDVAPDGRLLVNTLGKSRIGIRPLTLLVNWTTGLAK
jgi:serine/threonine protein kinase/Tol biopolymer transport system component